jgi:hypothetical protein
MHGQQSPQHGQENARFRSRHPHRSASRIKGRGFVLTVAAVVNVLTALPLVGFSEGGGEGEYYQPLPPKQNA